MYNVKITRVVQDTAMKSYLSVDIFNFFCILYLLASVEHSDAVANVSGKGFCCDAWVGGAVVQTRMCHCCSLILVFLLPFVR